MSKPPSVQKLMQSLGAIIISIPSHFTNKLTAITTIGDFFNWQEERVRAIESKVVELERRTYNIEAKSYDCGCYCRKQ